MQLADEAGADKSRLEFGPVTGARIRNSRIFRRGRSFSSSRSRLYLVGSSIVFDGGAIGLRIFAIKAPRAEFFWFALRHFRYWFSWPRWQTDAIFGDRVQGKRAISYYGLWFWDGCHLRVVLFRRKLFFFSLVALREPHP